MWTNASATVIHAGMRALSTAMISAGCGAPPPRPAPVRPPLPVGRFPDDVSMSCPGGHTPERHLVRCKQPELDPHAPNRLTLTRAPREPCRLTGVVACHVGIAGPPGSNALVCRDDQGTITGPVHLLAPDSSVITEGDCDHSLAIGAWFTWADGHLASAVAHDQGVKRGLAIEVDRFDRHVTARYHEGSLK